MYAPAARPIRSRRPVDSGDAAVTEERGVELIAVLARLPQDDPARPRLRDETIEAWLPMTRRLARRYAGRGEPLDDLVQAATVGLIKAIDRFDAEVGVDFTVFAIPTILGEIKRHFRDRAWAIRVPRRLQEMRMAISDAGNVLAHSLGRAPRSPTSPPTSRSARRRCWKGWRVRGPTAPPRSPRRSAPRAARGARRHAGGGGRRLCPHRAAPEPGAGAGLPHRTGADHRDVALLRQPDAVPDRRADRGVADARLPAAVGGAREAAYPARARRRLLNRPPHRPARPTPRRASTAAITSAKTPNTSIVARPPNSSITIGSRT